MQSVQTCNNTSSTINGAVNNQTMLNYASATNPNVNSSSQISLQQQQQQQQQQLPKDTTFTKIFVGGLPYHTTDESLKIFFQQFGNIEEAVVINDRTTGKSRGYGFVTMETKEQADAALLDPNPIIDGRKANLNLAYLGVKTRLPPQTTNFIPLAIRYPPTAALTTATVPTAAYGFHPFYYQPTNVAATTSLQNAQSYLTAAPTSLLLSTLSAAQQSAQHQQQQQSVSQLTSLAANLNSGGVSLFDLGLTQAYANAAAVAHLNPSLQTTSNRLSPFDLNNHHHLSSTSQSNITNASANGTSASTAPYHHATIQFNQANLSNQALSSVLQAATNASQTAAVTNSNGYYTTSAGLPQHLAFQSQLHDSRI